jgi:hypothetical protein
MSNPIAPFSSPEYLRRTNGGTTTNAHTCCQCGRDLKDGANDVVLVNHVTGQYAEADELTSPDVSCFPIGPDCARLVARRPVGMSQ